MKISCLAGLVGLFSLIACGGESESPPAPVAAQQPIAQENDANKPAANANANPAANAPPGPTTTGKPPAKTDANDQGTEDQGTKGDEPTAGDNGQTGTCFGKLSSGGMFSTKDITLDDCQRWCGENAANNPQQEVFCSWNNQQVDVTPPETQEPQPPQRGVCEGKFEQGGSFSSVGLTRDECEKHCAQTKELNPDMQLICTYEGQQVF